MTRTWTTTLIGTILLMSGSVFATTKTFQPNSGNWSDGNNWSPNGVPTEADDVVIPTGKTCNVNISTAVADFITVASGAILNIQASQKLTLDNDSGNATPGSTIHGTVNLIGADSTPTTLAFIDADHPLYGTGAIVADDVTCLITIAATKTVTSHLATTGAGIRGSLTIQGLTGATNGQFTNDGLVESTGLLILHANTILDDTSSAVWKVQSCSVGVLRFDRQALGLDGDFEALCAGTLKFNASVKTCGDLINWAGKIDIENSSTFQYVGFSSGSFSNPGTVTGTPTCNNPYTVSADADSGCVC